MKSECVMRRCGTKAMLNKSLKAVLERSLKASYTVEASWIMVITLGIFCTMTVMGFTVYKETLELVQQEAYTIDAVSWFRKEEFVSDLLDSLT